ncbi:MAG: hypothetical protein AAF267_25455 [Deinococcota bacterium]
MSLAQTAGNAIQDELLLILGAFISGVVWLGRETREKVELSRSNVWTGILIVSVVIYFIGNFMYVYSNVPLRIIWTGQAVLGFFGEKLYVLLWELLKRHLKINKTGDTND